MRSPCNSPIENYTDIFYIFYKEHVPSFQCRLSIDRSMSTGEVDGLRFIFIDLYVPELTPHLFYVQVALELSEYIALRSVACIHVSSAKRANGPLGLAGVIYIQTIRCRGQDGTLWHPCLYFSWRKWFTFCRDSEFSVGWV
jgi:hypothetical protein